MSYRTLLFPSQSQGLVNDTEARQETERDVRTRPDARKRVRATVVEGPDDSLLPSGIVSMEHWLDLNA